VGNIFNLVSTRCKIHLPPESRCIIVCARQKYNKSQHRRLRNISRRKMNKRPSAAPDGYNVALSPSESLLLERDELVKFNKQEIKGNSRLLLLGWRRMLPVPPDWIIYAPGELWCPWDWLLRNAAIIFIPAALVMGDTHQSTLSEITKNICRNGS
jgi:hypothetical protein